MPEQTKTLKEFTPMFDSWYNTKEEIQQDCYFHEAVLTEFLYLKFATEKGYIKNSIIIHEIFLN
jgi:hypothetical protein